MTAIVQWQILVLGGMLLMGMVALFRRRLSWFRACVAAGLLGAVALQLGVTPLDRRLNGLDREIAALPAGHPARETLGRTREDAAAPQTPSTAFSRLPFRLGLDLRGGTEIRLRLHPDQARMETLRREQQELVRRQASGDPNPERQMAISRLADSIAREQLRIEDQLAQAVDIVRYRLTGLGVSDIAVMRDGRDRILIQLPDMNTQEAEAIVATVEQQGALAFHMIVPRTGPHGNAALYAAIEAHGSRLDIHGVTGEGMPASSVAGGTDARFDWLRTPDRVTDGGELRRGYFRVVVRDPLLTGAHIIAARAASDHRGEHWRVQVEFDPEGAQRFLELSRDNPGRQLGILLDGRLVSAPHIGELVDEGRTEIVGDFAEREARDLAVILQSGALRVRVSRESQTRIGPSLGEDSIRRGVWSLVVGLVAVILFMVLFYRIAGLIAVAALMANLMILAAILSWLDAAVALPGIAGGILLVGITVDSAVLIYERLREELTRTASLHAAVHAAHDRAFTTIVDANVTTILAAGILYLFATDTVKGFCLVLVVGVLTGMFCSLVGIRWMLDGLAAWRPGTRLRMMPPPRLPTLDFVAGHRLAARVSLVLVLGSMALFAWMHHRGEAFGTEFTGGIRVQFHLGQPQSVANVRQSLRQGLGEAYPDAAVTLRSQGSAAARGSDGEPMFSAFSMSVKPLPGTHITSAASLIQVESEIRETFRALRPTGADMVLHANLVGPLVAREMRQSTLRAAGLAMAAIFLYIVVRFRRRRAFGWVAVVTLAHDVMITLGLLLLAGVTGWGPGQVDLKVAAALLTTMGYSLNDTIVIFDRIREQSGEGPVSPAIVNTSINRVLLRTLITSATTLLVVGALLVFGGQVLRGFAFTLLVGIVVGTYSSLFIAGPMVSRPSAAS